MEDKSYYKLLKKSIVQKKAKIGIIGMGYVGKALADLTTHANFSTLGFVTRKEKEDEINLKHPKNLWATTQIENLALCDVIIICVQTPVHKNKKPDLSYILKACEQVTLHMRPGQLIVIESSIAPGTTRNIAFPLLESSGLEVGKEYFLSFSPERVDPGNKNYTLDQIPKIVSGIEKNSLNLVNLLYSQFIKQVVPVSTIEAAELAKILENTYRLVNISLINELSRYAKAVGLDIWEVINAAATKPFGYTPHYPGPGIGGHCIPVDPFYLLDDAKKRRINLKIIEAAGRVNDEQPQRVVNQALHIINGYQTDLPMRERRDILTGSLNGINENDLAYYDNFKEESPENFDFVSKGGKSTHKKHKAFLIGLSYKPDIDDIRESAALEIWKLLEENGVSVSYHDPYIPNFNKTSSSEIDEESLKNQDIIIITTDHSNIPFAKILKYNKPILDTRNVYKGNFYPHVYYL